MKKFLLTVLAVFCFAFLTMYNNTITQPAPTRYTDGKMRLSLTGTERALTEGHKMADIANVGYLRVRFIPETGSPLVRSSNYVPA